MIRVDKLIEVVKILYVEDEEVSRTITQKMIKKKTKNLFVAKNGKDALDLFKVHRPDIVITDIRMPVLDGISMIKEIRKLDQECGIMITSELKDIDIILEGVDYGIDKYIIKPLDEEKIDEALATVIKKICKKRSYERLITTVLELSKEDKRRIEENIITEVAKFMKRSMGKGPKCVKVIMNQNVIEITAQEVLTSMEKTLIKDKNNFSLIAYNRNLFYECEKKQLEKIITDIAGQDCIMENISMDLEADEDRMTFKCF